MTPLPPDPAGASANEGGGQGSTAAVKAATAELFARLHRCKEGSPTYVSVRNDLVELHMPLVEHLARRFRNRGEPYEDLVQVATIGLIKAIERFETERGVEFSTYATPTVLGEVKRYFRDKGWAIRVPRRLQELRLQINNATSELTQTHGHSPTVSQLAKHLNLAEDQIIEGLESANAYNTLSLDAPESTDDSVTMLDQLGIEDLNIESVEVRESLKPLLARLSSREKQILTLRFFRGMTQVQIADEVGISQMHVSRLLSRTLKELRTNLLSD